MASPVLAGQLTGTGSTSGFQKEAGIFLEAGWVMGVGNAGQDPWVARWVSGTKVGVSGQLGG